MRHIIFLFLTVWSMLTFAAETVVVKLKPNSHRFIIKLPANPTTGFVWHVKSYDHGLFTLARSQYQPSSLSRVGAGGEMIFVFNYIYKINHPKHTEMQFEYARPWTNSGASLQQVRILL